MRPLAGVTVLSLEHAIAAPFATRQLAELGARVIKVERPAVGDFARAYDTRVRGLSSHFVWVNRSKESLTLDVKRPAAQAILQRLIDESVDVVVQNLAPGAAARLGLSYETLSARKPSLIVCDISGYGADGPYRDRKAYDLMIQSEAGFLSVTGTEQEPVKAGVSVADIAAGMYAFSNILASLLERNRTGRGRRIDVSMLESLVEWMGFPLYYAYDGAPPPPRAGASHASIYPYGPFPAAGGKTVIFGLQNEREWAVFCEQVLLRPELVTDERFSSNARRNDARVELYGIVAETFASTEAEELRRRLDAAGIANARVNELDEVWHHAQLRERGRWREIASPGGPIAALLPPGAAADEDVPMGPIPALGEHTEPILHALGYDAAAIARLREAHVI
jgi:crotonobetainyl-CoA:carnitine CoA-transferase CaiB-like acyl-CoA transferase